MKGIPTSKATQSANIIREAINRGEWAHYIPGERALSKDLMISRSCLRQALEILTEEKVLAPAEKSRRRAILKKSTTDQGAGKVIFFSPTPPHLATPMVLEQFAQLRHHLAKEDRAIEYLSSPAFNYLQISDETMENLTREHPYAHWVLHQCPEHIQRWFSQQSLRVTVLGSTFAGITLPNIDIDFRSASRHATGALLSHGHQRICLIRFRSQLAGDDLAVEGMYEAIAAHQNKQLPEPIILSQNFHVERLVAMLDQLFELAKPPTAIIVLNHHHFITAYSHILSKGIRIPDQVSIMSLSHDPIMDRLSPRPTSYTVGDRLIKDLSNMILNPTSSRSSRSIKLIPEMQAGKTIAHCPKG